MSSLGSQGEQMAQKIVVSDFLSTDEVRRLRRASNWRAASMFVANWLMIALAMSLVAWFPNILTVVLALIILGGRQLGLGILVHECSHRSFFTTARLNDLVGHWFAGVAIFVPIDFYRPYHLKHHTRTGTEEDPDVGNIVQYPVSSASFRRKVLRDLVGLSGLKATFALLVYVLPGRAGNAVSLGVNADDVGTDSGWRMGLRNYLHTLLFHGAFFTLLAVLGEPQLYALWWAAYLCAHPFIIRVRQIAEHGAMPALASDDVRMTTRTTIASLWERWVFAPNYVNYHCEHHLLPTVPSYNLPRMHALLKARGFYEQHATALAAQGYRQVLRAAIRNG